MVVLAATNRPDRVDGALLRPGRFDRLLHVPRPDAPARAAIFRIHTRRTPLAPDVDLEVCTGTAFLRKRHISKFDILRHTRIMLWPSKAPQHLLGALAQLIAQSPSPPACPSCALPVFLTRSVECLTCV